MTDSIVMRFDGGLELEAPAPDGADVAAADWPITAPPAEVGERDDLLGAPSAALPETAVPDAGDAVRPETLAHDGFPSSPGAGHPVDDAGNAALDGTTALALPESMGTTTPAGSDAGTPAVQDAVTPAALIEMLVETAAPRRNKRRRRDEARANDDSAPDSMPVPTAREEGVAADSVPPPDLGAPTPAADEPDDAAWREQWPTNAVHIVGRLLPRVGEAPVLDGVQRTRAELALVEHDGSEFGTMGNLPIFVMPGAPGFTPIYNEIRRARKQKRRLGPIMVEVHGMLRQMPDRDMRYASERYTVLMGVEVHQIKHVAQDAEQFAYWRGRAQVTATRRYEHRGVPYQRVTAVVALKQRKPRLRGTSLTHIPVEFLVAPEHEHADRFRHVGQHLLIEANIGAEVHRMSDRHPALEGIDDPRRKAQLQVVRETVVTVTLGEFPDEQAERAYRGWVRAGRPRPRREGRTAGAARPNGPATEAGSGPISQGPNGQRPVQDGSTQVHRANGRGRQALQDRSGTGKGGGERVARHRLGRTDTGS